MTEDNDERSGLDGHWEGLDRFLSPSDEIGSAGPTSDVQRAARKRGFPWSRSSRSGSGSDEQEPDAGTADAADGGTEASGQRWEYVGAWSPEAGDPAEHLPTPSVSAPADPEPVHQSDVDSFDAGSFDGDFQRDAGDEPAVSWRPDASDPQNAPDAPGSPYSPAGTADASNALASDAPASDAAAAYAGFEEWVPPWVRARPELIDTTPTYAEDELSLGRFAYADGEELPNPDAFEPGLSDTQLRGALEAILMVVNEPAMPHVLAQVLEEPTHRIEGVLQLMHDEYAAAGRGFELRQIAGGWRFYTRAEFASYVERFVLDGQQIRLTQAALETLAVVAYKQPVTRSRVAAIRGVNCDGVIKTLVTRGLVEECGQEPESGAYLYRTTILFLEKVGINSVDELPSIAPFLPNDIDEFGELASHGLGRDLAQR